jgi:uncharacterized protein with PQ loop repeat
MDNFLKYYKLNNNNYNIFNFNHQFLNDNIITVTGLLASLIGLCRFIPLIYEIHKTKKTNNFTYITLILALISSALWLIFGIYETAIPIILSSIISLSIYIYIIFIKNNYK